MTQRFKTFSQPFVAIVRAVPLRARRNPGWRVSTVPVGVLLAGFIVLMCVVGPIAMADYAPWVLLTASAAGLAAAAATGTLGRRALGIGLRRSAVQILPAIPILLCIALVATTWMISGVVPLLIDYGMRLLAPQWFLAAVCLVCAIVSVVTGSSWSTIATVGVAFMGIGEAMGQHPGWTAGAVLSGAYFGDKLSPLSDTTVVASSTCGVDLFTHIRYMLPTTLPALVIALGVYLWQGLSSPAGDMVRPALADELHAAFNLTPWLLVVPALTVILLACRCSTVKTLLLSAGAGLVAMMVFQPGLGFGLGDIPRVLWSGFSPDTGSSVLDDLAATGGVAGIMPVVWLILCALVFGSVMMGTGMLASLTGALTSHIRSRTGVISSSIATGLGLNALTADQYLSIIINGNMFRGLFRRHRMEARLLSRTLEDGVSATSPLIPWSSCGVTQTTVLGVATMTYLPYCIFNYLTPLMAIVLIATGWGIHIKPRRTGA